MYLWAQIDFLIMKKLALFTLALALVAGTFYYSSTSHTDTSEAPQYQPRSDQHKQVGSWNGAANFYYMLRRNQLTGEVSALDVLNAREEASSKATLAKVNGVFEWEEVGPDNIGGRTRAILVDNTTSDGSRVYAGSVSGGLFVSNDFGNNWQPVDPGQQNLCVSTIAQGPDGTIWFGTGSPWELLGFQGNGGSGFIGSGLYKLAPGSNSIVNVASASPSVGNDEQIEWAQISCVRVNANGRIYVGQNKGLRISDDGGNNWTNPVKAANGAEIQSLCHDIELTDDGAVLSILGGLLYRSDSGNDNTYTYVSSTNGLASGSRVELTISPANNNICYAVMCNNSGNFSGFYKSTDKGQNWVKIPMLASFNPFNLGSNPQGIYDMVCNADPLDANTVYIGGIDLYRYDGNITHISQWNGPQFFPTTVHADQHTFAYNPKNKGELYFGNDGGIFKTFDKGQSFFPTNRGYNVTQFYGMGYTQEGYMIGGAQDNGSIQVVPPNNPFYPKEGREISGGDGFDCEISQITPALFTTLYYGQINKFKNGGGGGEYESFGDGNFFTAIRLWESYQDGTSQDTITYTVEDGTTEFVLVEANGTAKTFAGTIAKNQDNLKFVSGSIQFKVGTQTVNDTDGDGNLSGDGSGTFDYNSGAYSVTFATTPANKTNVKALYQGRFNAGDALTLRSNTPEVKLRGNAFYVDYVPVNDLNPGHVVKVQDPVQSLLAFGASNGRVHLTRNSLRDVAADWLEVKYSITSQQIKALEFSKDGNHLFVGTWSGNVYRLSGLNNVYDSLSAQTVANGGQVSVAKIFTASGRIVTGIGLDPNNNNSIAVSLGGYGNTNYVYYSSQALTAADNSNTFASIQGDLPKMPVYDVIISNDGDKTILIGTEYGMYSSSLFTQGTWTDANGNLPRVPVFSVRQQTASWAVSTNTSQVYLGTHGRGFWKTNSIVGISEYTQGKSNLFTTDLTVYPNPAYLRSEVSLKINASKASNSSVKVFDIHGKLMYAGNQNIQKGENIFSISIDNYPSGNYFVAIQEGKVTKTAKFIVQK